MTVWATFPLAIARAAGFDYGILERLADPALLAEVGQGGLAGELGKRYDTACTAARSTLAGLLTDPAVREGIAVLAPDTLRFTADHVLRHCDRVGAPDKYERKIALFVQRLAAKCDTNAIAGTIGYAPLGDVLAPLVPVDPQRRGFVAHWVLSELVLRHNIADGRFRQCHPELGPAISLLSAKAAAGIRTMVEGCADWDSVQARRPAQKLDENLVASLHRRGVVWSAPTLPVAEPDALRSVRCAAADLDLSPLAEAADEYALGAAERKLDVLENTEKWVSAAGLSQVRRGAGQVYADRTVLYAEHYDPASGRRWPQQRTAEILDALQPVLDFAAATGVWGREQAAWHAADDLARLAGDREQVPLDEVLRELPGGYPVDIGSAAPVGAVLDRVADRFSGGFPGGAQPVSLTAAEVSEASAPWLPAEHHVLLASPDVFVIPAASGPPTVVVGEVHAGLTLFGNLLCFLPDKEAVVERARSWLDEHDARTRRLVNVAMGQRFGKVCHLEVMPRTLEVSGKAAQGRVPVAITDMEVGRDLVVRLCGTGEPVELLLASGDGTAFSPFAPPAARLPTLRIPGLVALPRLTVGSAVLQRATWWFPLDEVRVLGTSNAMQRYRQTVMFARKHGLPRRTFVRIPGEPKPVHLDLANPLLVDAVVRLIARAESGTTGAAAPEVRISEMLPEPESGTPMQEFRLSCVRTRP